MKDKPLRFHWSLSQAGNNFRAVNKKEDWTGLLSFSDQLNLCIKAEENGIDSMLMAIGFTRPDPLVLTVALGQQTKNIKFLVAVRSGLISPAFFVQQLNTASTLIGNRIHVNVVNGHSPNELKFYGDFLEHDERYERTKEFMHLCNSFWSNNGPVNFNGNYYQVENGKIETPFNSSTGRPEIFIGGNSKNSELLVCEHGDCLWRLPDTPENLGEKTRNIIAAGKEVGLMASVITRPTQAQAENAAKELLEKFTGNNMDVQKEIYKRFDSESFKEILEQAFSDQSAWITPYLWNGLVPYLGAPAIAFVGSYEKIAEVFMNYKLAGITQFLLIGWPDEEEVVHFGKGVLPLVRKLEAKTAAPVKYE
jgi:alkanesulfonate monooxygenase